MKSGWLTVALIRAGTLASSTAVLAAVFATPVAAQPASPDTADPPAGATQVERRDLKVEAFGDSYFTGVGAGQYHRPDARRQSGAAGFLQALARLEAANPGLQVTVDNHSSIGATIDDLYETQMSGGLLGGNLPRNAPQLQGVDPNADVAIMGFGGNDVGFVDAIISTFGADTPLRNMVDERLAGQLNNTRPTADYLADAAQPHGQQQTLIGELVRGIQDLRAAMPNAKIVVTTYPEAVDPGATSMLSVVSPAELAAFGELARALNESIRQAAALTDATVADNANAFDGHEVYTDDPYLHDLGPQWRRDDRDEAMHPNAAGQTVMSDAIADALAKVTGLNPAAPREGTNPYPTDGLTYTPRQPAIPTRPAEESLTPDPINWTPNDPTTSDEADPVGLPNDSLPNDGLPGSDSPGDGAPDGNSPNDGAPDGNSPNDGAPDGGSPSDSAPDGGSPGDSAPDGGTGSEPVDQPSEPPAPTAPQAPPDSPADGQQPPAPPEGSGGTPTTDQPTDQAGNPADPGNNTPGSDASHSGPADNPENGGDRDQPGPTDTPTDHTTGPADNPENGGDRDQPDPTDTPASHTTGPADNPENGGDRDQPGSASTPNDHASGPADNPDNGGDRDQPGSTGVSGGHSFGPADNPDNGGDRDESGSVGESGSDDGGDNGLSDGQSSGPADNPDNGGDRGDTSTSSDEGNQSSGPADNPENGGDRDSPSYGGWGGDPSTPIS
jgi:lysophospholipase L1-like esterase